MGSQDVDEALAKFYVRYERNQAAINEIEADLARAEGEAPWCYYAPQNKQRLLSAKGAIESQNAAIAESARACMKEASLEKCSRAYDLIDEPTPDPDIDFSSVQPWSLVLYPKVGSLTTLDFAGWHPDGRTRIFETEGLVFAAPGGVFSVAPDSDGRNWPVCIGTGEVTNENVVDICRGNFASRCHLRVTRSRHYNDSEGPTPKIVLTMLNDQGIATQHYEFHSFSARR